jgi:hypothetical protein
MGIVMALMLSVAVCLSVWANAIQPLGSSGLFQHTLPVGQAWGYSGLMLEAPTAVGAPWTLKGNGRLLFLATADKATVQVGRLLLTFPRQGEAFLDQVGDQVRVMVLRGKVTVQDGVRTYALYPSLQVVDSPLNQAGYFIDDGVYRRASIRSVEEQGRKAVVRQFYLEQAVFIDPILRTLYLQGAAHQKHIKHLNKTGAIIRQMNGTAEFSPGQV